MEKVLILCPTHRDYRELASLPYSGNYKFLYHDYASLGLEDLVANEPPPKVCINDPLAEIEGIVNRYQNEKIAGVISTDDYPGSTLASIIAAKFKLPGVSPAVNLLCCQAPKP